MRPKVSVRRDTAGTRVRAAAAAAAARLRVGVSTALGCGLLPRVRTELTARRPGAKLVVRQVSWDDPTAGLGSGRSDVGFLWLPVPDPEPYRWLTVAEEPRVLLVGPGHRLAGRAEVSVADVLDEPWLALPAESGVLRDFWLGTAERRGHPVRVAAEISATDETS